MINYPNQLNKVFNKLLSLDIKPVIVGGFVRDSLLGIKSKDIDVEVYNISSYDKLETILKEFGSVNSVGKSFGVCKLSLKDLELDFTLPRLENKVSKGHKGFDVEIKESIDFHTAARRRDFTINSIGYDIQNQEVLDPFGGVDDLKNKILRATSKKTFTEDPLRALRAVQFCARFELTPDDELKGMILDMMEMELLKEIARERVFIEFKKLLLKSKKPSIGFEIMKELNILDNFKELKNISQTKHFTLMNESIDYLANEKFNDEDIDTALMFGVISSFIEGENVEVFLNRFSNDKLFLATVLKLLKHKNTTPELFSRYKLSKLAADVKLSVLLKFLSALYHNDKNYMNELKSVKQLCEELNILDEKIPPILMGRDLIKAGFSPSEEFSAILESAYDSQLKGEFTTHEGALAWLKSSNY